MTEGKNLEFKSEITNTFLKTVSAFSNYDGGTVIFGIDDNGNCVGIKDTKKAKLDIENKINDSVTPLPDYSIISNEENNTIALVVEPGKFKPYLYKSKAYVRNDSSTVEVDKTELNNLILTGSNLNFESLPSKGQNLTFDILARMLKEKIGLENFGTDTLKTLNLYSEKGYNIAGELFADSNSMPGIDVARFGDNINIIKKRALFDKISVLAQYEKILELFKDNYRYEEIVGSERKVIESIPEEAFREAVANALIHRRWDLNAHIRVLMFEDRIEIISPGGLPFGITENEYLSGRVSILRNPTVANLFFRLNLVEIFGTGILRIYYCYQNSIKKPAFDITDNTIKITLPLIESEISLTDDEKQIFNILSKVKYMSSGEIDKLSPFGKTKNAKILKELINMNIVEINGNGRGTKYKLM